MVRRQLNHCPAAREVFQRPCQHQGRLSRVQFHANAGECLLVESTVGDIWRQLGALGAAGLLALLAYSAFRGAFTHATFDGGVTGAVSVGRLLFAHDALATEAVAALVVVALVGATVAWRARDRGR